MRLKSPHGHAIRPTSDRAREALFGILGDRVQRAAVLDLFAGTGALGIEALSRGACHATFVDITPEALILIKHNIQLFQKNRPATSEQTTASEIGIIKADLRRSSLFNGNQRKKLAGCYDLIFLDPPYSKGLSLQTLIALDSSDLLCENGLVIVEDSPGTELPDALSTLSVIDRRRYGDTGFWFYQRP